MGHGERAGGVQHRGLRSRQTLQLQHALAVVEQAFGVQRAQVGGGAVDKRLDGFDVGCAVGQQLAGVGQSMRNVDAAAGQGQRGRGGGRVRRWRRSGGRHRGRLRGAILGGGCGLACVLWHRRAEHGVFACIGHYLTADIQYLRAGLSDLAGVVHARGRDVQACSAQLAGFANVQLVGLGDQLAAGLDAAGVLGRRAAVAEHHIALAAERAAVVQALGRDLQIGAGALGGDRAAVAQLAVGRQRQRA